MRNVTLILDDGSRFSGKSFGYEKPVAGEVVFNTAMIGYPEVITDPSCEGQLVVLSYPLVGNYGVPSIKSDSNGLPVYQESERIHAGALIVTDYSEEFSHWNAEESLGDRMKREQIPGITGVDTRALTKVLRDKGTMMGRIIYDDEPEAQPVEDVEANLVAKVSCKEVIRYNEGEGKKKVVLLDCGVKSNIIRNLLKRDVEVIRVPWNYDFSQLFYDGLFISNGPGNPSVVCDEAVENIRKALNTTVKPIFGMGMGHQLLALAAGAQVVKLKYGHHGHNQPVRKVGTNKCLISCQAHGYAVDGATLPEGWNTTYVNMNDDTNEGMRHTSNPWFSTQFHSDSANCPTDMDSMYDEFVKSL